MLGLQIAGNSEVLANVAKLLAKEDWKLVERQLGPNHRLVVIDAKGRSLSEMELLRGRINNGEFGAVQAIGLTVPMIQQTK